MASTSDMLSSDDIEQINETRKLLARVLSDANVLNEFDLDTIDAYRLGQFAQVVEHARDVLFEVLNTAKHYMNVELSDEQLFLRG